VRPKRGQANPFGWRTSSRGLGIWSWRILAA